jgi:plastocyanin
VTLVHFFGGPDNLLSGWPKATGGDPKASLEPGVSERFCGDLLCAARPRTTSCPGHLLFRDCCFALIFLLLLASAAHADITGTVTLVGKPNSHDETFLAAASNCGESPIRHTENWKVGPKGELGDVVVWIVDPKLKAVPITHPPIPPPEIELKQLGCRYVPHVIAVQAGVNFKITNCDPTLHNIRAKIYVGPGQPPGADVFNFGQASQGQTDEKEFDDPGIYTLQCDVHGWMQCWVMVLKDGVFGVTGLDGRFKLESSADLADGDYKIDAWHPRFAQTLEQTIHVKNGTATVAIQFDGAKSF